MRFHSRRSSSSRFEGMPSPAPRRDASHAGRPIAAPFARRCAARVLRVLCVCAWMAIVTGTAAGQSPLTAAASRPHDLPVIEVRYREAADVFEMLDQVSAWWPDYVEPAYRQSWIDAGRLRPDDSTYFAQYAQLRARHVDRTSEAGGGERRGGSGLFTAGAAAAADPVATAFHQSDSLAEALGRLRHVLSPREIAFLRGFYAHFEARTSPLAAATRAATNASRAATGAALADTAVVRYVARVAALFSSPPSDSGGRRLAGPGDQGTSSTPASPHAESAGRTDDAGSPGPLFVLYVTWPDSMRTFATPSGRALILRVRPRSGETVNSADVVVHEAVHVFAAGMPEAQKSALSGALLDGCAVPDRVRRLAVLEEPIATALGNIEFRRRFMPQRFAWGRRWYGDAWVDVYARLLHPLLAERTATGRRLDGAFAREATGLCTALVGLGAGAR